MNLWYHAKCATPEYLNVGSTGDLKGYNDLESGIFLLALRSRPRDHSGAGDKALIRKWIDGKVAKSQADRIISVDDTGQKFTVSFEYDQDLVEERTCCSFLFLFLCDVAYVRVVKKTFSGSSRSFDSGTKSWRINKDQASLLSNFARMNAFTVDKSAQQLMGRCVRACAT